MINLNIPWIHSPIVSKIVNAILFQIAWFAFVLGGNQAAFIGLPVLLLLHVVLIKASFREVQLILITAAIGFGFDSLLIRSGVISTATESWLCPFWLVSLWAAFATTILHSLSWLFHRRWLTVSLGAFSGPLSYYAGSHLGAIHFQVPTMMALLILSIEWALAMFILQKLYIDYTTAEKSAYEEPC